MVDSDDVDSGIDRFKGSHPGILLLDEIVVAAANGIFDAGDSRSCSGCFLGQRSPVRLQGVLITRWFFEPVQALVGG